MVLANLCYRYGMSAVWLFGLERGLRSLFIVAGRQTGTALAGLDLPFDPLWSVSALAVLLVAIITLLLVSERGLDGGWSADLLGRAPSHDEGVRLAKADALEQGCARVAEARGLSPREREILVLLARHKTSPEIAQELFISAATAKTHARNIYRKLDVHSREELCALVEKESLDVKQDK